MTVEATPFKRNRDLFLAAESQLQRVCTDASFVRVFQNWLSTTLSQFDHSYDKCERQLRDIQREVNEDDTYWCAKTIIQNCRLHLVERRLLRKPDHDSRHTTREANHAGGTDLADSEPPAPAPTLPELVNLISSFHQIKAHPTTTPPQRRFLEQCEEELRHIVLEPRDMGFLTAALRTKLRDDSVGRLTHSNLLSCERALDDLLPDVQQCEQLLEVSIQNGEMKIAEDISVRQLEVYEHMLRMVQDTYPALAQHYRDTQDADRRRRWAIFRLASRDMGAVLEHQRRHAEACAEDVNKVRQQSEHYASDDAAQRRRYEADCSASDRFLREHKERQQAVWNRVQALGQELESCLRELSTLAQSRTAELTRRLEAEAQEAKRRGGYAGFCRAARTHTAVLQATQDNAHAAEQLTAALHRLVLDGCESAAARWDARQAELASALRTVQQRHYRIVTDYLVAAYRLCYRKERQLGQLREAQTQQSMQQALAEDALRMRAKGCVLASRAMDAPAQALACEVQSLRRRMESAEAAAAPVLAALARAGWAVVAPRAVAEEMNMQRWSTVLNWREEVDPDRAVQHATEEQQREREDIQRKWDAMGCGARGESMLKERGGGEVPSVLRPFEQHVATLLQTRFPLLPTHSNGQVRSTTNIKTKTTTTNNDNNNSSNTCSRNNNDTTACDMTNAAQAMLSHATTSTAAAGAVHLPQLVADGRHTASVMPPTQGVRVHRTVSKTVPTKPVTEPTISASSSSSTSTSAQARLAAGSESGRNCGDHGCRTSAQGSGVSRVGTMEGTVLRTLYAYRARAPDELNFDEGEHIVCVSRTEEEGWFRGVCNQRTGLFPINYVEPLDNAS